MYIEHFGLSGPPFENNLEPRFFYLSEAHREVLAALLYFVRERKSFALVSGDVGTGKTMLLSCLLTMLPVNVRPVLINHPDVGHLEIIYFLCAELGIRKENRTTLGLLGEMKRVLTEELAAERRTVLIIDEAHLLSDRSLEHIRLLSNIETRSHKLLQVLLVGQNELSQRLRSENLRQLRQRINVNRILPALDPDDTIAYIDHRLRLVGSSFVDCFEASCRPVLAQLTRGVPRLINQLCDNALLIAGVDQKSKVDPRILYQANAALRTDVVCLAQGAGERGPWWSRRWGRLLLRATAVLALAAGLLLLGWQRAAGWSW